MYVERCEQCACTMLSRISMWGSMSTAVQVSVHVESMQGQSEVKCVSDAKENYVRVNTRVSASGK